MLTRHLGYWLDALETLIPHRQPRIEVSVFDNLVLAKRLTDSIRPGLGDRAAFLVDEPGGTRGLQYYTGFALRITADHGETELGDGGLTTWTAQLTQDAKERCLVSCIATERLTTLTEDAGSAVWLGGLAGQALGQVRRNDRDLERVCHGDRLS